jgi:hypothetical protein
MASNAKIPTYAVALVVLGGVIWVVAGVLNSGDQPRGGDRRV